MLDSMRTYQLGLTLLIAILLVACADEQVQPTPTIQLFQPPTVDLSTISLQETEVAKLTAESLPTPTPSCVNGLVFIEDVTIEDGTVVSPSERLDKRWKLKNAGSCNWDDQYEVRLIAGPLMGVPSPQALFPALSDTEVEIRMVFTAPDEPGAYRSAWQAFDPKGNPFGDPFFIDIVVVEQ